MSPVTRGSRYKTHGRKKLEAFHKNGGLGDGEIDDGYKFFLINLYEDFDSSLQIYENYSNTSDDFEDDADPQYKEYLKNLRAKGNAYELQIPKIERNSQTFSRIKKRLATDENENLEKVNKETVTIGVKKDSRKSLRRNVQIKNNIEEPEDSRNAEKCPKRKVETRNKILEPKELRGKKVNSAKRSEQDADVDDNIVKDTCYQQFLDNIHIEGDCMVYVYGKGKRLKYEDDDDVDDGELNSDIEIIENEPVLQSGEMEINPSETPQLYISPMEGDDLQCIPNSVKNSKFRENLIENLKKPYDQEECDDLWHKVNEEKRKSYEKSTRNGVRKVIKDGFDKSYLERYKDLEAQLSSVQYERPKTLNILRGFFYWLQNSSHDGAFIPWKDPSCLAVMPGSK